MAIGEAALPPDSVLRGQEQGVLEPADRRLGRRGDPARGEHASPTRSRFDFLILLLIETDHRLFDQPRCSSVIYRQLINQQAASSPGALTALALALAVGLYAFVDAWVFGLYDAGQDRRASPSSCLACSIST